MLRHAILLVPFVLAGCATPRTQALIVSDDIDDSVSPAPAALTSAASADLGSPPSDPTLTAEAEAQPIPEPIPLSAAQDDGLYGSRFTVKAGYYGAAEDEIDDGYILGVSWMNYISRIFALELELGYLDADGSEGGVDTDVWALPVMVNGRLNAPLWILDVYGGAGVGTFYYDAEADGAGVSASDDGFLFGGNAFVGSTINLAEAIALGLELKYYITDEIEDTNTSLDAYAVMLTLGFSR